ncbi:MAG: MFS transporter [Longimicrobiales bacterium]|nr:MFS transporter [Longimicrobiales bacterium]
MTHPAPTGIDPPFRQHPQRWLVLALVSLALLLAMSAWFTATAVAPELRGRWGLSDGQVSALTVLVQWGFVAGTAAAALLNLADVLPSRRLFATSAFLAGVANLALLAAPGFRTAALLRFLTGFFLAGVYPPAMKMVATWFRSARGLAIGTVVGALTVGKAAPYLLKALGGGALVVVVAGASLAAFLAALLVILRYRDGPHTFPSRPFAWSRVGELLRHRPTMLATGGYLGHMWELYAGWMLATPLFLAFFELRGHPDPGFASSLWGFGVIASGGVGAVLAGRWADTLGRERVANGAMMISGACSLALGWLLTAPLWLVGGIAILWGVTIVADSAQFSAVVTEVAPAHAVGTALTLQAMLGFALTGVSMQLAAWVVGTVGWGPGMSLLALGPVAGIASMRRLRTLRTRAARP